MFIVYKSLCNILSFSYNVTRFLTVTSTLTHFDYSSDLFCKRGDVCDYCVKLFGTGFIKVDRSIIKETDKRFSNVDISIILPRFLKF